MKKLDKEFTGRLKSLIDADESLSAFARRIGMPPQMIRRYLSGETSPSYEFFLRLGDCGFDLNWLVTGVHSETRNWTGDVGISQNLGTSEEYRKKQRIFLLLASLNPQSRDLLEKMLEAVSERESDEKTEKAKTKKEKKA